MNILQVIVNQKKVEIEAAKSKTSVEQLKNMPLFKRSAISMSENIRSADSSGIIAEFKRHSPSKKWINQYADPVEVVSAYANAGAAGSSVLTDEQFFKGSLDDFSAVRKAVEIPLLRKEFIVDPYQVYESKAYGADTILLIAAILTPKEVGQMTELAHELNMEVLLELHTEDELGHVHSEVDMVGINNRDLKTFKVDIEQSARMAEKINVKIIKIAESGIDSLETINYFKGFGFDGFLIGERFMRSDDPGESFKKFINSI